MSPQPLRPKIMMLQGWMLQVVPMTFSNQTRLAIPSQRAARPGCCVDYLGENSQFYFYYLKDNVEKCNSKHVRKCISNVTNHFNKLLCTHFQNKTQYYQWHHKKKSLWMPSKEVSFKSIFMAFKVLCHLVSPVPSYGEFSLLSEWVNGWERKGHDILWKAEK